MRRTIYGTNTPLIYKQTNNMRVDGNIIQTWLPGEMETFNPSREENQIRGILRELKPE